MLTYISPLAPLVPAPAVFSAKLPELVWLLEPDATLTDHPYPDPAVPPERLVIPPSTPALPDFNNREPPCCC